MNKNVFLNDKMKIKNKIILLEVALILNKELYDENRISFKMFKYTEDNILKDMKELKGEF